MAKARADAKDLPPVFSGICFVAIVVYRCCNNVVDMLQSVVFRMQLFLVYVCKPLLTCCICVLEMLQVSCECFKIRYKFFDVATLTFDVADAES
jgi:hypothetical protein